MHSVPLVFELFPTITMLAFGLSKAKFSGASALSVLCLSAAAAKGWGKGTAGEGPTNIHSILEHFIPKIHNYH